MCLQAVCISFLGLDRQFQSMTGLFLGQCQHEKEIQAGKWSVEGWHLLHSLILVHSPFFRPIMLNLFPNITACLHGLHALYTTPTPTIYFLKKNADLKKKNCSKLQKLYILFRIICVAYTGYLSGFFFLTF